ncbi:MAG: hypothetical protein E6H08_07975 [Bacteroidetes bacterium]|jgi:preprotein translocase subunit SecG|nr:MAG: hypothetical protein E6H08_07975 [Bacteroidota bacterium]
MRLLKLSNPHIYSNTVLKKRICIFFLYLVICVPALFSQGKDSLAQVQEMQRLNRLGDSLHREQLKRDSAFAKTMEDISRNVNRSIEESKQKEVEQATQQVMQQHEKEQLTKRKTMLLAMSAFLIALFFGKMIFRRKKSKDNNASTTADAP